MTVYVLGLLSSYCTWRQTIVSTKGGLVPPGPLGTQFSEIWVIILHFFISKGIQSFCLQNGEQLVSTSTSIFLHLFIANNAPWRNHVCYFILRAFPSWRSVQFSSKGKILPGMHWNKADIMGRKLDVLMKRSYRMPDTDYDDKPLHMFMT